MALIALGVCGGIGAYKAVEVARGFQKRGHDVAAIMTPYARRFDGPDTFEAITHIRVITDQFAAGANADLAHIALATAGRAQRGRRWPEQAPPAASRSAAPPGLRRPLLVPTPRARARARRGGSPAATPR
jgi:hypothetical protein